MTSPDPATPQGSSASPDQQAAQKAAVAQAQQSDQLRSLAAVLSPPDGTSAVVIKGSVTAVTLTTNPPTISVTLSGDATAAVAGVRFIDSYSPVVGDTVLIVKQGSDLFALGQMTTLAFASSIGGWVAPTLATNITTSVSDAVQYRVVIDNGDRVVQLRGGVTITSAATLLWTMPTGIRPLSDKTPFLVARDIGGGTNACQLLVKADGTLSLQGGTTGITGVNSGGTGSTDSTTPGSTGLNDAAFTVAFTDTASAGTNHNHNTFTHGHPSASHSHTIATHTHTTISVTAPTTVSLNGISYYL